MPVERIDEEPGILACLRRGERIDHSRRCAGATTAPARHFTHRISGAGAHRAQH
jgi:hypothetical protein